MKDLARLFGYVWPWWRMLTLGLVCTMGFALFSGVSIGMVVPFTKILFDRDIAVEQTETTDSRDDVLFPTIEKWKSVAKTRFLSFFAASEPRQALLRICIGIFAVFLIKGFFSYFRQIYMATLEERVIKDLRDDLYKHIQRLPIGYFERRRAGVLISRITNDVQLVRDMVGNLLSNFTQNSSLLLIFLVVTLIVHWKLAMLAFLVFPLIAAFTARISKRLRAHSARFQEDMGRITSTLQETIAGIRVVKAFGMEPFEDRKFGSQTGDYMNSFIRFKRTSILASPIAEQLGALGAVVVLWYGGNKVIAGDGLKPEEFFLFLAAVLNMMQPLRKLSHVNTLVQQGIAAARRIFEVLDTPIEPHGTGQKSLGPVTDKIRFDNVSFAYDSSPTVLSNISLDIESGSLVAVVGPSGAGKSTLADLLARFHEPSSGAICIDGEDIRTIDLSSLRENIGFVTQEVILFHDTVRNNIAYGRDDIPLASIVHAAKAANAHAFIEALPDGYETEIGDRGLRLSGGERQRLAVARAILKDPPILILDEATSSLDTESEALVQEAVETLVRDRTTLVIAHRLSTIQRADRIVVLERGKIVQTGKHDQLVTQDGLYRRLFEMQFGEPAGDTQR